VGLDASAKEVLSPSFSSTKIAPSAFVAQTL